MRNLFLYVFLLISSVGAAQTGISYQLLVYDSKQLPGNDFGQIKIRNRNVDIRFSVLDRNMQVEYQEESTYTTDNMGYVNAVIGSSQQISGYSYGFESITWEDFPKFLRVEIDINQNNQFILISEQSFTFSPYSFYSINSYKSEVKNGPQGPAGSGTDSQTIEVSLSGNVLRLLPENTTVTKTVDLSSLGGSGTDSQTIEVSLSGNVLRLLPENTTVTKTVDLSSLGGSGTDSQTIAATLSGTILQLLPENTTVSATVDLSSIDLVGDILAFSSISSIIAITTTSTLYTVPAGSSAEITAALPNVPLVSSNRIDYKPSDRSGFNNSWQAEFSIFVNGTEIYLGHSMRYDTSSGGTDAHPESGYINARLLQSRIILPEGSTIRLGDNLGYMSVIEYPKEKIDAKLITSLQTVPVGKTWKIVGILNSGSLGGYSTPASTENWSIDINGQELYLQGLRGQGTSDSDINWQSTKFLLEANVFLPSGITLEPNGSVFGIMVL